MVLQLLGYHLDSFMPKDFIGTITARLLCKTDYYWKSNQNLVTQKVNHH